MPWGSIFADKYSATFSGSIFADAHKDINNYVHAHICSFHVFKMFADGSMILQQIQ